MPHVLTHAPGIEPAPHASNGARLVSFTGKILPLRHITLVCDATGGIARTKLRQHFRNEYRQPLELVYTFPLPADGAVSGYEICAFRRGPISMLQAGRQRSWRRSRCAAWRRHSIPTGIRRRYVRWRRLSPGGRIRRKRKRCEQACPQQPATALV
jgi:vault protein inter-alpha-trypsin-like protein